MIDRKVIVDTNLLLLFVAGMAGIDVLKAHRRLQHFEPRHFDLLTQIIAQYAGIVTTPHCLAELWNLFGENKGGWDTHHLAMLRKANELIGSVIEIFDPASSLIAQPEIRWLGLADVSQLVAAGYGCEIVTMDGVLCHAASGRGLVAHNFSQIMVEF